MSVKKSTLWTIVIVIILVVLAIVLISIPEKKAPADQEDPEKQAEQRLKGAEVVVPEGSLVTKEGEVITETGEIVNSEAPAGSSDAPKHSRPLAESEIPKSAVKLSLAKDIGFTPDEFTVTAGSPVTISIASDGAPHFFRFRDEGLQGVAFGIIAGRTRAITFNAPEKGDYEFFCDTSGHESEIGVMHVK